MGNTLKSIRALEEAREPLQIVLRHMARPGHEAEILNRRAIELASEGKLDEAIEHLSQALRIRPDFAEAHCNMGNALRARGQLDKAVQRHGEAIRLDVTYAEARNNMGMALAEQRRLH